MAKEESFPGEPPAKGEPKEPPRPPVLDDARPKGEALEAWLKLRVGFWAGAAANDPLGAALPKTDPFDEPLRAEKGDGAAAKPEREEFPNVRDDLEAGPDLSSSPDVACEDLDVLVLAPPWLLHIGLAYLGA